MYKSGPLNSTSVEEEVVGVDGVDAALISTLASHSRLEGQHSNLAAFASTIRDHCPRVHGRDTGSPYLEKNHPSGIVVQTGCWMREEE